MRLNCRFSLFIAKKTAPKILGAIFKTGKRSQTKGVQAYSLQWIQMMVLIPVAFQSIIAPMSA